MSCLVKSIIFSPCASLMLTLPASKLVGKFSAVCHPCVQQLATQHTVPNLACVYYYLFIYFSEEECE